MIHVHINAEFEADDLGPRESYTERFVLPPEFATDAMEAHAKLLTLIATERYFELPQEGATWLIPLNSETVRMLAVSDS